MCVAGAEMLRGGVSLVNVRARLLRTHYLHVTTCTHVNSSHITFNHDTISSTRGNEGKPVGVCCKSLCVEVLERETNATLNGIQSSAHSR
jgi:hypothetical protein